MSNEFNSGGLGLMIIWQAIVRYFILWVFASGRRIWFHELYMQGFGNGLSTNAK